MKITFSSTPSHKADAVVVGIYSDLKYTKDATALDKELGGAIKEGIAANYFKGEEGQTLTLNGLKNAPAKRVLVVGLGKEGEGTENSFNVIGAKIASLLRTTPDKSVEIRLEGVKGKGVSAEQAAAFVASGAMLRSWRFDKYHTKLKDNEKPKLTSVTVVTDKKDAAAKAFEPLEAVAEGVFFTRDLVSEPANILYPEELAKRASELKKLGVTVEVLDEKKMKALGMGALLGVGQGSARESQLVVMQWNGGKKSDKPLAFVGKGVTFDTGGISLKPSAGMEDMKGDMGGAGAVVGLMKSLALRKAKVNAVGVIGCVENMPGGNAQRPGDVVKTMSGQTIEVLNTDAEGRLVLSDALWYTQDRFKPQFMVNLATLTGAIVIALGHEYAGLFSNNDELAKRLAAAGEQVNEKLWRLPLHKNYDKDIDSDVADVANQQKTPRAAGSITAAQFLQRFVNDYPWAHLDIAGVEAVHRDLPLSEKGATGFGVRLLDRLVSEYYEGK